MFIRAWRISRGLDVEELAARCALAPSAMSILETDNADISLSQLKTVADALGIPPAWLHVDPEELKLLLNDDDNPHALEPFLEGHPDPMYLRILQNVRTHRELYALLTALLDSEDAKLIRAAEVSLKSLLKQSRHTALPWQSRVPGNFEPPSD